MHTYYLVFLEVRSPKLLLVIDVIRLEFLLVASGESIFLLFQLLEAAGL
jgi:hypothetical protein